MSLWTNLKNFTIGNNSKNKVFVYYNESEHLATRPISLKLKMAAVSLWRHDVYNQLQILRIFFKFFYKQKQFKDFKKSKKRIDFFCLFKWITLRH